MSSSLRPGQKGRRAAATKAVYRLVNGVTFGVRCVSREKKRGQKPISIHMQPRTGAWHGWLVGGSVRRKGVP